MAVEINSPGMASVVIGNMLSRSSRVSILKAVSKIRVGRKTYKKTSGVNL